MYAWENITLFLIRTLCSMTCTKRLLKTKAVKMPLLDARSWLLVSISLGLCAYVGCAYQEEYVCSLNNSSLRYCNVSYNNTCLVLSYQGNIDTDGFWIRGNDSGPYVDTHGNPLKSFQPICWNKTCKLNKSLNNSDSGPYYFIPRSFHPGPTQQYPHVIVNILAPPTILNVTTCENDYDNWCIAVPPFQKEDLVLVLSIGFIGNGPFNVTWTFNGEPYVCNDDKLCRENNTKTNIQTLRISTEYPKRVNGTYVATVSNRYGSMEAYMYAIYDCNSGSSKPAGNKNHSLVLTEGSPLNYFCNISGLYTLRLYGCYTHDKHQPFSDIELSNWTSYCADLPLPDTMLISKSDGIRVQKTWTTDDCSPVVHLNFKKSHVTFGDSGLLYCAWLSGDEVEVYETVTLSVEARKVKPIYYAAPVSAVLGAGIVLAIALFVGYKFHKLRKKNERLLHEKNKPKNRRQQHAKKYVERITGGTPSRDIQPERAPLINSTDSDSGSPSYGSGGDTEIPPEVPEGHLKPKGVETSVTVDV